MYVSVVLNRSSYSCGINDIYAEQKRQSSSVFCSCFPVQISKQQWLFSERIKLVYASNEQICQTLFFPLNEVDFSEPRWQRFALILMKNSAQKYDSSFYFSSKWYVSLENKTHILSPNSGFVWDECDVLVWAFAPSDDCNE